MATEVIHEHSNTNGGNGTGIILGVLLTAVFLFILFYLFGAGNFLRAGNPSVQVPDQIDVNLNQK